MVGDAARFVRIQCGDAAIVFGGGGNAVDEYVMVDSMRDYLHSMTSFLFEFGRRAEEMRSFGTRHT